MNKCEYAVIFTSASILGEYQLTCTAVQFSLLEIAERVGFIVERVKILVLKP